MTEQITIKRDGLKLCGILMKPELEQCPICIIFHGFMSNYGRDKAGIFSKLAAALYERGIASVRFDFNGHGDSDGEFYDMNVFSELLDAAKILEYVRSLPFVSEIYIAGHSQGGVVGSMLAGYYREHISKLLLLAPAATMKDDALRGSCFGTPYDYDNVPDFFPVVNIEGEKFLVGNMFFRILRTIPIHETAAMFEGPTLIIHGSADEAVQISGSQKYVECMKNCELRIREGDDHGLEAIDLDDVIRQSADFLAGKG